MGAIIGGAIGSVVGASIAPKKGKETRQDIVDAAKSTKKSGMLFFQKIKKIFHATKSRSEPKGAPPAAGVEQNERTCDEVAQRKPPSENLKIPNEEKEIK